MVDNDPGPSILPVVVGSVSSQAATGEIVSIDVVIQCDTVLVSTR